MVSPHLTLEDIVANTRDLPSIPAAAMAVMREVEKSTSNAQSIARILIQDQAISARVLRLANSAYYGLSRQVADLQEAVVILGMRSVRNLALVAGTYPWLSREIKGYALGPKAMWTHSLGVAVGAQMMAKQTKKADGDMAFMCGLLHNLGKVILATMLEGRLGETFELAIEQGLGFDEAERQILGFDHCEVGSHLALKWNLPDEFYQTMLFHHQPDKAEEAKSLVDCVHMGDFMAMSFGIGMGGDGLAYALSDGTIERLELTAETLDIAMAKFPEEFVKYEQMFDSI